MKPVDLFHVGPPKTATTWVYRCLAAHPGVAVPRVHSIHYFDMHYWRGEDWYASHFASGGPGRLLCDPTFSYLRSPWAARRIAAHNPAARIALCLRHPIDRAFSHWWHEKKKGRQRYPFEEVLRNYDLFASWLEPGFYAEHLERYLEHFERGRILAQRFEDLERDPRAFLRELLSFFGLDAGFVPGVLETPINVAGPRRTAAGMGLYSVQKAMRLVGLDRSAGFLARSPLLSGRGEYLRGVPAALHEELMGICEPEIVRLERLLGIDLGDWRSRPRSAAAA